MTASQAAASSGPGRRPKNVMVQQLVLAAACGGYAAGALFGWGSALVARIMGDFGLAAAAFLAAASCLWYAHARADEFRPAWLLFGLSSLMIGMGNVVWGWYEVVLRQPVPRTSAADICFLLFAPLAIIGLLMLAKRPVSRAGWVCLALDAWLIGGSLLTLSWSVALAHTAAQQGETVPRAALALAYPLLDIALVSMVLVLHFRRSAAHRSAVNTALGALALTVLCDALFTSPILREQYSSGQLLDAGWFAGSMLLASAPWSAGRSGRGGSGSFAAEGPAPPVCETVTPPPPVTVLAGAAEAAEAAVGAAGGAHRRTGDSPRPLFCSLAALTPYLAAAVCTLSILVTVVGGGQVDRVVVVTACAVVLALLVRQGIMLTDNTALARELARKENYFRSLVQGSSDVIMIAAPDGRLRYVSPAAAGVYGQEADLLIGSELSALIHPEDVGRVLHELRRFLSVSPARESATRVECRVRHGAGHWLNVESSVNRHQGGLIFNSRDVTERVRLQAQLQHSASHDPLTDLPNRALFTERVRLAVDGGRTGDREAAVLFIDLDGFKAVNDTAGHQAGDELLVHAAQRLRESVRGGDLTARLGGDEFAALIAGENLGESRGREQRILEIAERVRVALSRPYAIDGRELRVAASIGVAFAEPGITPVLLMRNADLAMYRAKQSGKARVELYVPQLRDGAGRRAELTDRLRRALNDGEFALLHQPIVELADGRITAVAAQARWRSSPGPSSPGEAAEVHGSLLPVTAGAEGRGPGAPPPGADRTGWLADWLLDEAVAEAGRRHRAGWTLPVSVRLPDVRLAGCLLGADGLESLLTRHGVPPEALVLELPEAEPCLSSEALRGRLADLSRLGVGIALDGFGSSGTAVAALHRLPVDLIRLDRELVDGVLDSPVLRKITAGLLRMAADLGIASLADGVDMPEQAAALRAMGCRRGQGPAFCEPLDAGRLRRVLDAGRLPVPAPVPRPGPSVPGPGTPETGTTRGPDGPHSETSIPLA